MAKKKVIFNSNIPVDKDGNSIETVEAQTDRLLNGNKYGNNDKDGRGQKMDEALDSVETLFGSNYALSDTASEMLIAKLRAKADIWENLKAGSTTKVGKTVYK